MSQQNVIMNETEVNQPRPGSGSDYHNDRPYFGDETVIVGGARVINRALDRSLEEGLARLATWHAIVLARCGVVADEANAICLVRVLLLLLLLLLGDQLLLFRRGSVMPIVRMNVTIMYDSVWLHLD